MVGPAVIRITVSPEASFANTLKIPIASSAMVNASFAVAGVELPVMLMVNVLFEHKFVGDALLQTVYVNTNGPVNSALGVKVTLPAAVNETVPFKAPVTLVKVRGNPPGSLSLVNTFFVTAVPDPQLTFTESTSGLATGGCGPERIVTAKD